VITLCGFGVSNYYNKLRVAMLEKGVPFAEATVYPWERERVLRSSPLGKIPYIETAHGGLSESEVIFEYLEEVYPETPLFPVDVYTRAKCRELIQHLELNVEWVARRLYREVFFGGAVSQETKLEARERLVAGLSAVARLTSFAPYAFGASFSAADCVGFFHLEYVRQSTRKIYDEDLVDAHLPGATRYLEFIGARPHFAATVTRRADALATFKALNVPYDG
jgi:glutathione S-transferase